MHLRSVRPTVLRRVRRGKWRRGSAAVRVVVLGLVRGEVRDVLVRRCGPGLGGRGESESGVPALDWRAGVGFWCGIRRGGGRRWAGIRVSGALVGRLEWWWAVVARPVLPALPTVLGVRGERRWCLIKRGRVRRGLIARRVRLHLLWRRWRAAGGVLGVRIPLGTLGAKRWRRRISGVRVLPRPVVSGWRWAATVLGRARADGREGGGRVRRRGGRWRRLVVLGRRRKSRRGRLRLVRLAGPVVRRRVRVRRLGHEGLLRAVLIGTLGARSVMSCGSGSVS